MTTTIRNLGDLLRAKLERREPASWRNRAWVYAPASSHGDSSAFRARMREYARRADRETDAAQAASRG